MKKAEVKKWLKENSLDFTTMTDEQKTHMRKTLGICGAATSSSGYKLPCSFPPMKNGRCKSHGGLTPVGTASASWKHGRYSRYLPSDILEKYNEALEDPELLSLRQDIAITQARLGDLFEQLNEGGGMEDWSRVRSEWNNFIDIQRELQIAGQDQAAIDRATQRMRETVTSLSRIIGGGHRNISLWHEIRDTTEALRRLIDSEAKRIAVLEHMIPAERMMAFTYRLLAILKNRIQDAELLSQISADIRGEVIRIDG